MSKKTEHPLEFECYKCGKQSSYPNYLTNSNNENAIQTVVKRCTICGAENSIELPKGYESKAQTQVLRGLKNE